ncbi:MAG: hypothetical protein KAX69_02695 [Chitinophagales bacterium]|nr:hypothetical protein [Chitinophagales bacterium]MCC6582419.1 hypothetical protein [Chitinophagales bacterium]
MKTQNKNNNFWLITGLISAAVIFRILSNTFFFFNFTPVIAIALFSGAKFQDKKWSVIIPVVSLFISDVILSYLNNFDIFHNTILFTYGSILLVILLGRLLNSERLNISKTAVFTLLSSLLFFVITNIGVWLFSNMYTLDLTGLTKCFVLAIPFLQKSIAGDLFFATVLFGVYELVSIKLTSGSKDMAWQKSSTID